VPAQPPVRLTGLRQRPVPQGAGGVAAITSSLRHTLSRMGPLRTLRALARVNQANGFDCPGCAWPDPQHRSIVEFCENGAKAVAEEATTARITAEFFAKHTVADLAEQSDHWLGLQGRLTEPMVLRPGATHYTPIAWDEAFTLLAKELNDLPGPDVAAFYTSGRTSNEAAFLYQLFVRQFGTNNLPDCSNMCHESSGTALNETLGIGKGTVTLEDFDHADGIWIIGQNPGTNHPRMLSTLQAAARRGCRIVSINPLREPGLDHFVHPQEPLAMLRGQGRASARIAELFVQVRVGGDVALLQAVGKALIELEDRNPGTVVDRAFRDEFTSGYEPYARHLRTLQWPELLEESGVDRLTLDRLVDTWRSSRRLIACWAMGLTQHKHAVANIQEVVNLLLLGGHMGRPGAGACPVRGHSNVQGDRTMGIFEKPPAWTQKCSDIFGFQAPREEGLDVVGTIEAMRDGRVQALVALGGNFLSAAPDTEATAQGLRRCRLTVQVSTKLNRSHLVHGQTALILPCLGRTEVDVQAGKPQCVTVENSMGVVHRSQGQLPPASTHLLSEPAIVARMAHAVLGKRSQVPWLELVQDYDGVRDLIAEVVPGFADFNRRVRAPHGFVLPNGARDRTFATATGKANFTVHPTPRWDGKPGQLRMMTVRSHDQYNTTIYGLDDRYRGILGERRVILMHASDLAERDLQPGQRVDITSHFDEGNGQDATRTVRGFLTVAYDVPRGCAVTYFPEANPLVALGNRADRSRTPASKSVNVTVVAAQG
jgi:molybdopterin-dependent oxidoreductase alpha subunit